MKMMVDWPRKIPFQGGWVETFFALPYLEGFSWPISNWGGI
jgi:hypothetical protein